MARLLFGQDEMFHDVENGPPILCRLKRKLIAAQVRELSEQMPSGVLQRIKAFLQLCQHDISRLFQEDEQCSWPHGFVALMIHNAKETKRFTAAVPELVHGQRRDIGNVERF